MTNMGRPPKITKRRIEAFCEAISIGCTDEMAAAYARIDRDTALNWLKRGEAERQWRASGSLAHEGDQPYVDFFGAVEQARLEAGVRWQQVVDKASNTDPAWALRMLRYRFPNDYREVSQTEVSGPGGGALEVVIRYADSDDHAA